MVSVKSSSELSKVVLKLFSDKEYRARMSIYNRKRAIDFFDEASVVENTFTIFDNEVFKSPLGPNVNGFVRELAA